MLGILYQNSCQKELGIKVTDLRWRKGITRP
jgi:hypothetical protein